MESELIKLKYDQEGGDEGKKSMERESFLDCSDTINFLIEKVENLYSCLLILKVVWVGLQQPCFKICRNLMQSKYVRDVA
jgi:hypothetical protein